MPAGVCEQLRERVSRAGVLARDRPLVAMYSGGRDSSCLLDVAHALLGSARVCALHVNYGLRPQADEDEEHCRALCERLGIELRVLRARADEGAAPSAPAPHAGPEDGEGSGESDGEAAAGNLQAWAREL